MHEHTLGRLMIAVIERFTAWRSLPRSIRAIAAEGSVDFRIRKAVRMMTVAPGTISDMGLLATKVGMSRAHFFRQFEHVMRVSPRVFLNVQRIEHAVSAVSDGEDTFAIIGERLGFSVPAHFSRFFHDHAGSTPSAFRQVTRLASSEYETPR